MLGLTCPGCPNLTREHAPAAHVQPAVTLRAATPTASAPYNSPVLCIISIVTNSIQSFAINAMASISKIWYCQPNSRGCIGKRMSPERISVWRGDVMTTPCLHMVLERTHDAVATEVQRSGSGCDVNTSSNSFKHTVLKLSSLSAYVLYVDKLRSVRYCVDHALSSMWFQIRDYRMKTFTLIVAMLVIFVSHQSIRDLGSSWPGTSP